jgi:hypothetical protein
MGILGTNANSVNRSLEVSSCQLVVVKPCIFVLVHLIFVTLLNMLFVDIDLHRLTSTKAMNTERNSTGTFPKVAGRLVRRLTVGPSVIVRVKA